MSQQEQPGLLGKKTRSRAKRRDYKRELIEIKNYCEVNVEVLRDIAPPAGIDQTASTASRTQGKIDAFEAVIKRIAL